MKVLSIVGARPQFVKLAPVSGALTGAGVEHAIVHTGQHYDASMSDVFFSDLGIPAPDISLGVGSGSHAVQTAAMLTALEPVLRDQAPDWVLVYGDTNSTLAGTLSAVKLQLPVAHLEAGLRSGNRAMPEEHNRVLTDHASDLLLAPTQAAMTQLGAEGLAARAVLVGDVMVDLCRSIAQARPTGPLAGLADLDSDEYLVATIHRAENTDDPERLQTLLGALMQLPLPVVLPVHPRLRDRASEMGVSIGGGALRPWPPLAYPSMVQLVAGSRAVLTDSGGLQKEAYTLGVPCTTLRAETEWVETLVNGWNMVVPDAENISDVALRPRPEGGRPDQFGDGRAADRVVAALVQHRRDYL